MWRRRVASVALASTLAVLSCRPALAADPVAAPTAAVVVDYQRILRDSNAAQSIRDQIEARRRIYQEEIAREEKRLHELDRSLAEQRDKKELSTQQLADRRRDLEQQVAAAQRKVQQRRRHLDDVQAAALVEVRKALIDIIGKLAESRGFNLVLPSSEVLMFAPALDVTEPVLAQLNERLPSVKVPENVD